MFAAFFAPDDTSKNPDIIAFETSLRGRREQSAPERAEKVMTQAQTVSMFFAAFDIASVITKETGWRGRHAVIGSVLVKGE